MPKGWETPCSKQASYLKFKWKNKVRTHNHLVCKRKLNHSAKLARWLSCVVSNYLYYAFDCMLLSCLARVSELHFVIFLDVKELLARSRRHIWRLSDSNEIRTYNCLYCKETLNDFAKLSKWLSCAVSTYLYSTFDCMLFSCCYHARSFFTFRRIKKCGYTVKFVRETTKTYSQMHRTDKDS